MNQYPPEERLYNLLPAIYRIRDQAQGEPLKALLAIAARELQVLEEDIDNLYENWFIETCDEWVVPYIGDLLDVEELYAQSSINYGQQQRRAYVANTIAYRRRKGTAPVLEQLTRDITDWRARAVEFFQRLATTQNLNHIRPEITTVNLRQSGEPEFLGTPFEQQVSYSVNIGNPVEGRGFHNIANIGLYIWRLQSYPIEKATAKMVKGTESEPDGQYYTFSPLGLEQFPLFNQPQTETDILHLAEEINVPAKLRRLPLEKEINNLLKGIKSNIGYFDANPVLEVFVNGETESIPPEEILIAPLKKDDSDDWISGKWKENSNKKVAVDPESGRLAFPPSQLPSQVEVSYFYGFSGDIGGGSYERNLSGETYIPTREISQEKSLSSVIDDWNLSVEAWKYLEQGRGVVLGEIGLKNRSGKCGLGVSPSGATFQERDAKFAEVGDNEGLLVSESSDGIITVRAGTVTDKNGDRICLENDCQLDVSAFAGESLILFIAHQPRLGLSDLRVVSHGTGDGWLGLGVALKEAFDKTQTIITITDNKTYSGDLTILIPADKTFKLMAADGYRPHLQGNLYVQGITPLNNNPGELILNGLLIEGKLTVLPGSLRSLNINHCTLVPQKKGLNVATWEVV
ncbi:MAG: phage tail protein, partial [Cyanobacteriota bacterium]|nr:phage tail protein [Cyanobacteriota bacterium]